MANLSQLRRQRMLAFLEKMREQHKDDDEVLVAINEVENEINEKKYGLVWEEHSEEVEERMVDEVPIFVEDSDKEITMTDNGYNFLLEGDNLHSLHLLEKTHKEKIDVIYIDPPYNTGNGDFIYDDKEKFVGLDDTFRHSKWLSFMERRLRIAKKLLKSDGAIFISIDDNEQSQLKLLCDDIFGVDNFLACLIINSAPAGTQSATDFAIQHSYCLAYRKSSAFSTNFIQLSDEEIAKKYNYGEDELGKFYIERIWKRGIGGRMEDVPSLHFPVWYNPDTAELLIDDEIENHDESQYVKIIPYQTVGVLGRWTWSREKMRAERDHLIVVKVAGEWKLHKKMYAQDDRGKTPYSIIGSKIGRTELGSLELKKIFNAKVFDYPKYSGFVKYLVSLHDDSGGIVLDFFAGSGTTGQAVLELNKDDGGNRKFILCTNNENGICDNVTYPRLETVITGTRPDGSKYSDGIPADLKYYHTDYVPKNSGTLAQDLISHIDEMIQLEYGVKIDREKYISILTDEDADELEKNWQNFPNIRAIYISRSVLLTGRQRELFETKDCFVIPDYYFREELRDAGEA